MWFHIVSCAVAVCTGSPTNPSNGAFGCGSTTVAGQACSAACSSGYTAGTDGLPRSTCSPTGTWGAVSGSCILIGMVAPYPPAHGLWRPRSCSDAALTSAVCATETHPVLAKAVCTSPSQGIRIGDSCKSCFLLCCVVAKQSVLEVPPTPAMPHLPAAAPLRLARPATQHVRQAMWLGPMACHAQPAAQQALGAHWLGAVFLQVWRGCCVARVLTLIKGACRELFCASQLCCTVSPGAQP
jgi:hypothetical protein